MKVRMKVTMSGTRNGVDWPPRGETVDLPNAEAVDMINAGLAEPATSNGRKSAGDGVETAAESSEVAETRARRTPLKAAKAAVKPVGVTKAGTGGAVSK